ncbi:MAG: hypothetical protein A2521_13195 [Deltaproteobacteria bacterium RIFOXYD12_FULL_57_12]|nr:MAG: hypothetical protein A2521_13195 [Deltaproteobacteria bacterium RIFOXYD12_FULL_57_12]
MKRYLVVALLPLFVNSACTSSLNGVASGKKTLGGEPVGYYRTISEQGVAPKRLRAEQIAKASVEEIIMEFHQDGYRSTYEGVDFDGVVQPTSDGAIIQLTWTSPRAMFPPGGYNLNTIQAIAHNQREGVAFVAQVANGISNVINRLEKEGLQNRYHIQANYSGSADGLPIRGRLAYRGEFGEVSMPADRTTLNGRPYGFIIKKNQPLDNEHLAALRAFGLKTYLYGKVAGTRIEDYYTITTMNKIGGNHRSAQVTIKICDN